MTEILNKKIDEYFEGMVKDLQDFIKIKSVLDEESSSKQCPFGKEIDRALNFILEKGNNFSLKTKNVDGYAGYMEIGEGKDMVGILSHIDVVPAGSGWSVDPYSAEIVDNKLYGRGSLDDKGPAMAVLYALRAIQEAKLPTSKRARLIVGTDEETAGRCIKYYLKNEEPPVYGFSPDANFPIIYAEKGILRFEITENFNEEIKDGVKLKKFQGGTRVNVVPDYAEAILKNIDVQEVQDKIDKLALDKNLEVEENSEGITVKSKGISCHAMNPSEGLNAIQLLLQLLANIEFASDKLTQFLNFINIKFSGNNGKGAELNCTDDVSGNLTINIGIIDINEKQGSLRFDLRYPVTVDGDKIITKLKELAKKENLAFKINQHKPPLYVEKDTEFIKKLQKVYQEMTGQEPKLISIGGGTYCRYVKNTVSFGPVFPGQKELAHQRDEYIRLEDLKLMTKIYAQAIYELIK